MHLAPAWHSPSGLLAATFPRAFEPLDNSVIMTYRRPTGAGGHLLHRPQRRLRPRCCHLGSYFKRPKSSPVRPLACNWYYCAHFIAKPKAACALSFSWTAKSSNLGLSVTTYHELHNISLRRQRRTEPRPQVTCIKIGVKIGRVVPEI